MFESFIFYRIINLEELKLKYLIVEVLEKSWMT